jgi:hypothetical protein
MADDDEIAMVADRLHDGARVVLPACGRVFAR